jgi:hypothetical protein
LLCPLRAVSRVALMMKSKHEWIFVFVLGLVLLFHARATPAQGLTGSMKGTVSATAGDASAQPELIPGARLTLVNRDLKGTPLRTVTNDTGNFAFLDLPAGNYTLAAEADGLPSVKQEISLTTGATLVVEIILTATVTESVTVREEEGQLSTAETTTSNVVRARKLEDLPLRADNYQSSLSLTAGVVRGTDGADHIKGTRAGQNSYTLNGADITDPVNGTLAFDIPLEAAASVHVEENPYSAEVGKSTGGSTNLETKSGGDKFKFGVSRFFPAFHKLIGGKIDSFRPRLTFEGPVIRKRLNFLVSLEYRFSRIYVPSLPPPGDDSTAEAINLFTQLDLTVNNRNRLKLVGAMYPEKKRYVGLNTFNPQETTANTKQRGELFSVSDQAIFPDESFLSSLLSYKTFAFKVFSQGLAPLTILPDGNTGSYFADTRRSAQRVQWQEQYFARTRTLAGQHSLKIGAELDYTKMSGNFDFRPILIRRHDQTLSQRIDFRGPTSIERPLAEVGAFAQDRWVINQSLTLDLGLRFDRNGISRHNNVSPRASILYLPFRDGRTTIRGGIGLFYDRSPLSSRYFEFRNLNDDDELLNASVLDTFSHSSFPGRVVTTYGTDGVTVTDGPREFLNVIRGPLHDARATRWSLQVDRELTKKLTLRVGYLQRSTKNEPIIIPGSNALVLESRGRSQYKELQLLVFYDHPRFHNWTVSYVWSRAKGDLNTTDNFLGDFPGMVVRANQFGILPFDIPHRFLAYGEVKAPLGITIMPALEVRSGFPFSFVDERLDFIGPRNHARFPAFLSLDVSVLKSFRVPVFDKHVRAGVVIFNITNHFNPRDVQNNTGSLHAGEFFNSLRRSVRGKFEMDF